MLSSVLSLERPRLLSFVGLMEKQSFANTKKTHGSKKKAKASLSSVNISTDQTTAKKKGRRRKKQKNVNDLTSSLAKLNIGTRKEATKSSQDYRNSSSNTKKRVYVSHSARATRKLSTLEDLAHFISIGPVKNVVVMAGAGISTGSGIPDFRTPGTGLYDNLKKYKLPNPTAVFDLNYFHNNPKPFYELAKELYPSGKYQPNFAHYFIRCLYEKGILLRAYTQNIDGLERLAGIPPSKLVEAHGTFSSASCTNCGKKYNGDHIKNKIFRGVIPRCEVTPLCFGIVKPDIVFFGEDLPKRFYYYLKDFPVCDLLLVMGTSLEVEPFASLVDSVRVNTPRVLFNRDRVGPFKKCKQGLDLAVTGDITDTLQKFSKILKWLDFIKEIQTKKTESIKCKSSQENDTKTDDSGISSSSSVTSEHKEQLPPLKPDMKRYFHTLRSTPLPKKHPGLAVSSEISLGSDSRSGEPNDHASDISYYDFIRKSLAPSSTKISPKNFLNLYNKKPPVIHYTETRSPRKKPISRSKSCITVPCTSNIDSSDTTSDTSDNSTSDSSDS